jgi:hypothetical protein
VKKSLALLMAGGVLLLALLTGCFKQPEGKVVYKEVIDLGNGKSCYALIVEYKETKSVDGSTPFETIREDKKCVKAGEYSKYELGDTYPKQDRVGRKTQPPTT